MNPARIVRIGRTLAMLLLLAGLSGPARAAFGDRIAIQDGHLVAGGQRIWINGANTPWHNWNDFGGSFDAAWWDAHFQSLHEHGINATRVWITCDGSVGILIDERGRVSGATPRHWADLDQLFAIAQKHRVYLLATLLSFDHFKGNHRRHAAWRKWIADDANIDSYVANYLRPFLRRYGKSPWLWSIDLINEPDWVHENADNGRVPWERLQSYFARAAQEIHRDSPVLVTVGLGMLKYGSDTGKGCVGNEVSDRALQAAVNDPSARLDFYSVHYYDWCGRLWGNALYTTPAAWHVPADKPSVITEMPAAGTKGHTTTEDYTAAWTNGWEGAMGWTSDGVDAMGSMAELGPATAAFRDAHPDLVFPPAAATAKSPAAAR